MQKAAPSGRVGRVLCPDTARRFGPDLADRRFVRRGSRNRPQTRGSPAPGSHRNRARICQRRGFSRRHRNTLQPASASIPTALKKGGRAAGKSRAARLLEVPVCYDPNYALDLEEVAEHCGLSPNEVVTRHVAGRYHVRCIGFTPGFPYLSGLPTILMTTRRATPRTAVPAGSVAIAGRQAGIYPLRSPGGWNVIGRTPLRLFDVTRKPAAFCAPGDRLRFVAITREEFERWKT